ncbi:MAG: TIGR02117 family protein [Gillisia sp.]
MKHAGRFLKFLLGILGISLLLYLVLVVIGAAIPMNSNPETINPDIKIYLISNGVHVDIAVPLKTKIIDWTETVTPQHTLLKPKNSSYVSFGWGDLLFYENTPEWKDLTFKIAFKALFLKTPSAIHTRFHDGIPKNERIKSVMIDSLQYRLLSEYIQNTFIYDDQGETQHVEDLHYSGKDAFYKARGSLNLFNTCNTWVNEALKHSGLKACLWTPIEEGIFLRYP